MDTKHLWDRYVWQFITLAGFHSDALITDIFAKDYAKRGMLAYVFWAIR